MGVSPGKFHGNSPGQFAVRPSTDSVHHRFSVTHLPTKKNMAGSKCYFTRNNHRKLVCFNMEGTTESHGISRSTMVNHHRQVFSGPALRQDIFGEPPDGGLWRRSPFKWCPVTQYVSWNMTNINYQILCGHIYIYIICHEHIYILSSAMDIQYIYNICHEA